MHKQFRHCLLIEHGRPARARREDRFWGQSGLTQRGHLLPAVRPHGLQQRAINNTLYLQASGAAPSGRMGLCTWPSYQASPSQAPSAMHVLTRGGRTHSCHGAQGQQTWFPGSGLRPGPGFSPSAARGPRPRSTGSLEGRRGPCRSKQVSHRQTQRVVFLERRSPAGTPRNTYVSAAYGPHER